MNKIEELLQEAEVYKPNGLPSNWDDDDYILTKDNTKKLVELIIRECIEVIDDVYNEQIGNNKACRRIYPYQEIVDAIENHFEGHYIPEW